MSCTNAGLVFIVIRSPFPHELRVRFAHDLLEDRAKQELPRVAVAGAKAGQGAQVRLCQVRAGPGVRHSLQAAGTPIDFL